MCLMEREREVGRKRRLGESTRVHVNRCVRRELECLSLFRSSVAGGNGVCEVDCVKELLAHSSGSGTHRHRHCVIH